MMVVFIIFFNIVIAIWFSKFRKPKISSSLKDGRLLLRNLGMIKQSGRNEVKIELPVYKLYTSFVFQLLELNRKLGTPIGAILKEIRTGLQNDLKFEIQKREIIRGALMQFVLLSIVTWIFVYSAHFIISIKISSMLIIIMILLQVGSASLFFIASLKREKKTFSYLFNALFTVYRFKILSGSGLSVQDSLNISKINELLEKGVSSRDQFMQAVILRLKELIFRWRTEGAPLSDEMLLIIDDLWFWLLELQKDFTRSVNIYKFLAIFIGILPSYFAFIFSLFEYLLT